MKRRTILIASTIVPILAMFAIGFTIFSLTNAVGELRTEISRSDADVILASADIGNDTIASVPILYYDQFEDECVNIYDSFTQEALKARQFEWSSCGYYNGEIEEGLTEYLLDDTYLPIAVNGSKLTNRGIGGENFKRWFNTVEGKSKNYAGTIGLKYDAKRAGFSYDNSEFYPLNKIAVPNEKVNSDGNNHLFTLNLGVPFQVLADGNEEFTISADDDTWVYVGDQIVIDMGGVHGETTGKMRITDSGEVYAGSNNADLAFTGVRLKKDSGAIIRIFHADRDSESSVFRLNFTNMVLNITRNSTIAKGETDGIEVAYDPQNPSYVAPLGESLTVGPNRVQGIVSAVIIQVAILIALSVLAVVAISVVLRYSHSDRIQE